MVGAVIGGDQQPSTDGHPLSQVCNGEGQPRSAAYRGTKAERATGPNRNVTGNADDPNGAASFDPTVDVVVCVTLTDDIRRTNTCTFDLGTYKLVDHVHHVVVREARTAKALTDRKLSRSQAGCPMVAIVEQGERSTVNEEPTAEIEQVVRRFAASFDG